MLYNLLSLYAVRTGENLFRKLSTLFCSHHFVLLVTPSAVDKLQQRPAQNASLINKLLKMASPIFKQPLYTSWMAISIRTFTFLA
jgi:hypothetical protein